MVRIGEGIVFTWYNLFKFVHVSAVIVWVGGVVMLALLNARIGRENDGPALMLTRQSARFGQRVVGPSAGITFLAGLAMLPFLSGRVPLWVWWGLVAFLASMILGATLLRRTNEELTELQEQPGADPGRLASVRGRLSRFSAINIAILLVAVWAMVFKPTL